jgi:hypothetical protein
MERKQRALSRIWQEELTVEDDQLRRPFHDRRVRQEAVLRTDICVNLQLPTLKHAHRSLQVGVWR